MGYCPWNDLALADRSHYGRMGHLVGDSWSRGYALGVFAEAVPPSHPMYRLRSPAAMAETVFADNGRPDRFCFTGIAPNVAQAPDLIRERIRNRVIRSGDVVFVLDAGDHNQDPGLYATSLAAIRDAVTGRHDITCVLMTTPDYSTTPAMQWDTPFNGQTMNQAIRAVATADVPSVGQTLLLDLDPKMDTWKQLIYGQHLLPAFLDPIHPNFWGQALWTGEMLKAGGWRGLTSCVTAQTIAAVNPGYTFYNSPYMTDPQARTYMATALLR